MPETRDRESIYIINTKSYGMSNLARMQIRVCGFLFACGGRTKTWDVIIAWAGADSMAARLARIRFHRAGC